MLNVKTKEEKYFKMGCDSSKVLANEFVLLSLIFLIQLFFNSKYKYVYFFIFNNENVILKDVLSLLNIFQFEINHSIAI